MGLSFCHEIWHASSPGGRTGLLYTLVLAEAMQDYSLVRSLIDQTWRIHFCSINKMWQKSQTTYLPLAVPRYKKHVAISQACLWGISLLWTQFPLAFEQKCISDMKDAKVETAWLGREQRGICQAITKWRTNKKNKSQFNTENLSKEQRCFLSSITDCPSAGGRARGTLWAQRRNSNDKVNISNKVGTSLRVGGSSLCSPPPALSKAQPRPSTT